MRRLFGIPAWDDSFLSQTDFAWMLADAAAMAPQYGAKSTLCSYLNSTARDTPNSPAPNAPTGVYPTGWAALQAFAAFANFHYGPGFGYQVRSSGGGGMQHSAAQHVCWMTQKRQPCAASH